MSAKASHRWFELRAERITSKIHGGPQNADRHRVRQSSGNQISRQELASGRLKLARRFLFQVRLLRITYGACFYARIEYYRPKGQRRSENLIFGLGNWLNSCGICNDEKWTEFPERDGKPLLLDPTVDEPRNHISFRRNVILALSDSGAMQRSDWLVFGVNDLEKNAALGFVM